MHRILAILRMDVTFFVAVSTLIGVLCSLAAPLLVDCKDPACTLLDLSAHWLWLYLTVALYLLARTDGLTRKVAVVTALLAAGRLAGEYTTPYPLERVENNEPVLRVMQANVYLTNPDTKPFVDWVKKRQPDVIVVQEVPHAWKPVLESLSDYPHHRVLPSSDSFGIAVLSKHPFESVTRPEAISDTPSLDARIKWQGQVVRLIAVHPIPPLTPHLSARRDARLAKLSKMVGGDTQPALLVGDFNATPWSTGGAAVKKAGLTFASPLTPTWPSILGPLALLPLDHVAVNKRWFVIKNERGPDIGSDHFPIDVTLKLIASPPASEVTPAKSAAAATTNEKAVTTLMAATASAPLPWIPPRR